MLFMIINHFFVDGAQHICLAWGVCHPRQDLSYITCEECVEGMEWVQAYMTDPLWVAEYTLYLEQVRTRTRKNLREDFTIMEKATSRTFSWLKVPTSAFTFKTLW